MNTLNKAIELSGGTQQKLADLLGVKQQHVSYWVNNGLPICRAIQIETALNKAVTRQELLPEIFNFPE